MIYKASSFKIENKRWGERKGDVFKMVYSVKAFSQCRGLN